MEDHLSALIEKLALLTNQKLELFSGVWLSKDESNPYLISINDMKRLPINITDVLSLKDFTDYLVLRTKTEEKLFIGFSKKKDEITKVLDDFESKVINLVKEFRKKIMIDFEECQDSLFFSKNFIKDLVDGTYKKDDELVTGLKNLAKSILHRSFVDLRAFEESHEKSTDISFKIENIKKVFENVKKSFEEELKKQITIGIQANPPRLFEKSKIVKPFEDNIILGWLNVQKSFELLFSASESSFSSEEFHKICDSKGPTVVFIQTSAGKRFGGYANSSWNNKGNSIVDEKCFLFSLDLQEKYLHKSGSKNSMFGHSNFGPTFGGNHDLCLYHNCNSNSSSYCNPNNTYDTLTRVSADIAGNFYFTVKNYEVYLVK